MPDSDLGDCEGKVVGVGVTREYLSIWRGSVPPLSPFGNIYVMAGSVVQCSHDTVRGTGGTGGAGGDNCNSSKYLTSARLTAPGCYGNSQLCYN